jgi:hypothetical protein
VKKLLCVITTLLIVFSITFVKTSNAACFLEEFLIVYQGDWIFVPNNDDQDYYSVDIFQHPCVCDANETECCGRWEIRTLDNPELIIDGLFCIKSTYEVVIKDDEGTWEIYCIGVRGGKIGNIFESAVVIGDPSTIEGKTFQLVRPH